ncbi:dienelactone hydrolase family protein [Arthrobacter sp. B2a2-09]|uniref:dienelactone hydrolase family protein n=1 Tax=Arthrobacter sp. B2a2-09 TaxID=2952822 RepID=UPI0022CD7307|nr:dienelactone hydrolase family protein [Arthrobacter sp. B2a2-09]
MFLRPIDDDHQVGAVVAVHQHAGNYALGKSELAGLEGDPQMAFAAELAESGVPALVPDLLGFEERQRDAVDGRLAENRDAQDLLAGGSTLQGVHTRDIAMATSWLEACDDVTGPLGIVGHSLGGQVGLFNLACDPRLRAGVLSCGIGTLESFEREGISHNPAWFVPNLRKAGDVHLVAQAIENQRVLIVAGQEDPLFPFQDVQSLVSSFREGVADFVSFDGGHAFPSAQRGHAVSWLKASLIAAQPTP